MPDGTVFWGVVLKQIILGVTAFTIGVMLYRSLIFERRRHRPFLAIAFLSMVALLIPVSELVVRAPLIDPDWRALLYTGGVLGVGVGFLGDLIRERKRMERRRSTD